MSPQCTVLDLNTHAWCETHFQCQLSGGAMPGGRCWALMRGGMSAEDVLMEEETMLQSMRADFQSLERVQVRLRT